MSAVLAFIGVASALFGCGLFATGYLGWWPGMDTYATLKPRHQGYCFCAGALCLASAVACAVEILS
jgi:hypothetical protein